MVSFSKECQPFQLSNGVIKRNMNNVGAKKAYQCKEGYREETGRKSSTCQASGLWDYEPTCSLDQTITTTKPIPVTTTTKPLPVTTTTEPTPVTTTTEQIRVTTTTEAITQTTSRARKYFSACLTYILTHI